MTPSTFRSDFPARLREIRDEIFGDHAGGIAQLAEALGIPRRTWENYETGAVVPDVVVLKFVSLTGAEPRWLLSGEGERYRLVPGRGRLVR